MTLLILTETSAGYALLKAKDKKLLKRDDLSSELSNVETLCSELKLKQFQKFDSAAAALEEAAAIVEGKVTPKLSAMLNELKDEKKISLAVADPKLGNAIGKIPGLEIKAVADSTTAELYRAIREHLPSLIPGLVPEDMKTMSLGLSHSLARHKLKFSPDKIDVMIVQAIGLLDDLDKELNTYAMRVKEWYGWHFPEMAKILNDNLAYAKVVLKMGMRENFESTNLAEILPEEIETAVKSAADRSMGTEITQEDLENIQSLAEQVVQFTEYRQQLASYLSARMTAIAPNLTALVGELVGARLIAHAGSLVNLSKSPASTIQILGAEKALFRALKTKHDTPKYGLIYHASLIGQATGKNKGKMARVLAAKAALGIRVDSLQDWGEDEANIPEEEKAALGIEARSNLERKLAAMEGKPLRPRGVAIAPNGVAVQEQPKKWEINEARKYNPDADGLAGDEAPAIEDKASKKKSKKDKKLIEEIQEQHDVAMVDGDDAESQPEESIDSDEEAAIIPNGTPKKLSKEERKAAKKSEKKAKKAAGDAEEETEAAKIERLAAACGLSVVRYQRKLERGEISFTSDGTPVAISKKDIKKAKKQAEKAEAATANGEVAGSKKRKHVDEESTPKDKKKKKSKAQLLIAFSGMALGVLKCDLLHGSAGHDSYDGGNADLPGQNYLYAKKGLELVPHGSGMEKHDTTSSVCLKYSALPSCQSILHVALSFLSIAVENLLSLNSIPSQRSGKIRTSDQIGIAPPQIHNHSLLMHMIHSAVQITTNDANILPSTMKVLDPQSALLTNAEVFQFLQTNPPRAAEKQIGSYPTTNLGGHATIRKDFERYASEITPFVRDHAAVDGWIGEVVRRLKPFELTKTEVLNLVNMGVGTRGATVQKGEEEDGGEGEGEGEEEVDEEAVMGRDVQFFKVAVEEAEERFPGEEGEERIREVVSILKEIIQAKNETEPTRINGK